MIIKNIVNFVVLCLVLSHCVANRMKNKPTKQDAIRQAQEYKQLKIRLELEERPKERLKLLQQMDSLNQIKNPYKYIKP